MFSNSIVQVISTHVNANPLEPWRSSQLKASGTGFVIDYDGSKWIITNAHCVENSVCAQIKFSSGKLYDVIIERVENQIDLALLKISTKDTHKYAEFQSNAIPLAISKKNLKQGIKIEAHGFTSGQGYFLMKGQLGRMEVGTYNHSGSSFLTYGTTCPIKGGNSGGPLIYKGEVIGVTHQLEVNGPTHGIPSCILSRFLDYPEGLPEISMKTQHMVNPHMRNFYNMKPEMEGILILDVDPFSPAYEILKKDDILLEVDGYKLNNEGKIQHPVSETPIYYTHVIYMHRLNEIIALKILRDGEERELQIQLTKMIAKNDLVGMKRGERQSDYYHFNGLLIAPLTKNYYNFLRQNSSIFNTQFSRAADAICMFPSTKSKQHKKLFVIIKLLESTSHGLHSYPECVGYVIKSINGKEIDSFRTLVEAFNMDVRLHRIELNNGTILILPNLTSEEEKQLLHPYQIAQGKYPERIKTKVDAYREEKLEKILEQVAKANEKDSTNKTEDPTHNFRPY